MSASVFLLIMRHGYFNVENLRFSHFYVFLLSPFSRSAYDIRLFSKTKISALNPAVPVCSASAAR